MLNQKNLPVIMIAFAVIHIAVTFSAHALFQGSVTHPVSWEYKIYETKTEKSIVDYHELFNKEDELVRAVVKNREERDRALEEFGRDGWEIYWVTESGYSYGDFNQYFYLKRPL